MHWGGRDHSPFWCQSSGNNSNCILQYKLTKLKKKVMRNELSFVFIVELAPRHSNIAVWHRITCCVSFFAVFDHPHTHSLSPSCCFPAARSAPPSLTPDWLLNFGGLRSSSWLLPLLQSLNQHTGTKVQQGGCPGDASPSTTCSVSRPPGGCQEAETSSRNRTSFTDGRVLFQSTKQNNQESETKIELNVPKCVFILEKQVCIQNNTLYISHMPK